MGEILDKIAKKDVKAFVKACHKAGKYGLVRCSSGNMSWRRDKEHMLITSSRSWMGELLAQQVSLCRIADGSVVQGGRPSVETGFHAGILQQRQDVEVVLHFQTMYATTLACSERQINYDVIPEIPYYIGPIGKVAYYPPGSQQLAEAIVSAAAKHDLVMMGNHGQVVVGNDFDDAIQKAVFFELACEIIVKAEAKVRPLTEEQASGLRLGR